MSLHLRMCIKNQEKSSWTDVTYSFTPGRRPFKELDVGMKFMRIDDSSRGFIGRSQGPACQGCLSGKQQNGTCKLTITVVVLAIDCRTVVSGVKVGYLLVDSAPVAAGCVVGVCWLAGPGPDCTAGGCERTGIVCIFCGILNCIAFVK